MIGAYWEYLAMIFIGVLALICWMVAWDARVPMPSRWSFFWYGLILMIFELFMIAVNVRS